jgi:integrase
MLKAGIHPKIVSERLGHANISITLDTYSHVLPGLQEAAAERFDKVLEEGLQTENKDSNVCKMFAKRKKKEEKTEKIGEVESEPSGARTLHHLIKSQVLYQLS